MAKANQYHPQSVSHPGTTLSEKLTELGMGPKEFAVRTGKPEKTITAILKGDSALTPDMAVLFENVLHIPARFWLQRQLQYDEAVARAKAAEQIKQAESWAKAFPVVKMIRLGWLPVVSSATERTAAMLNFFGVSTAAAWSDYYLNTRLKNSFRISLAHAKDPHAISAWLRRGELQASELQATPYSESAFRNVLTQIKRLTAEHPVNFFEQLQTVCLTAGVKVVHTPCLPKAPISGATRWVGNHPLIQLSCRYKRNDIFWFTVFHEAGHILLHGKKDIFLEAAEFGDQYKQQEQEADDFAVQWTLNKAQEQQIVNTSPLTVEGVHEYAKTFGTHPAIIIGRLIRLGILHTSVGYQYGFFEKVELDIP